MKRGRKPSDYGTQLREKQKLKRLYGVTERQLKAYYKTAAKERAATGEALLRQLEMRLDNTLFRAGFTPSRSVARQVVNHGGVLVNGKKIDIASAQVKPADTITLLTKALNQGIVKETLAAKPGVPAWLARKAAVAKVERAPQREEMETMINERQIVEFYSR
jgi:small subunit ribosomal protein S4